MKLLPFLKRGALVAALSLMASCSCLGPQSKLIHIIPSDPEAHVYFNGHYMGKGEQKINLRKYDDSDCLIIAQNGNRVGRVVLRGELTTRGALDILGMIFIVPAVIGNQCSGTYRVDAPGTIYVHMVERPPLTDEELRVPRAL